MSFGLIIGSAFITALAFVLIMYYLLFFGTKES